MSFAALHKPGQPLIMPNPWDVGSARMLESLGFAALATTSAGAAFTVGQQDGALSLDQMLTASKAIKTAVSIPVSADLENGGGDDPRDAETAIHRACQAKLDGGSIEDWDTNGQIYPLALTLERAEAAHKARAGTDFVLTLRTEIMLTQTPDLDAVLERIAAFAKIGADVVFAPGLSSAAQIRAVVDAADGTPVNVLIANNSTGLSVLDLAALGVARISTGSALARLAYGAMIDMTSAMRDDGTITYPGTTASFPEINALLPKT